MHKSIGDDSLLGPCCRCDGTENVRNLVMLNRRGPTPGKGWGCVICNLPPDGAVAVMCDECVGQEPIFVCCGYPVEGVRALYADLPDELFDHDNSIPH